MAINIATKAILKILSFGGIDVEVSRQLADLKRLDPMKIFYKKENVKTTDNNKKLAIQEETKKDSDSDLKEQLEDILQNINGVGKVKVLITYSQTSQVLPLYNEDTSKKDTEEKQPRNKKAVRRNEKIPEARFFAVFFNQSHVLQEKSRRRW